MIKSTLSGNLVRVSALAAESDKCPGVSTTLVEDPPRVASNAPPRLRALVERHYDFVWRALRRLGVPERDAEDAAQEVFVSLSRRLDEVGPERVRGFLYRTAMNHAAHVHRTRLRRREISDEGLDQRASAAPTPEDLLVSARAKDLFYRVLEQLELDLRAVFLLYELERLTMAEISELLELPAGTVASRLRRARVAFLEATRLATRDPSDGGDR